MGYRRFRRRAAKARLWAITDNELVKLWALRMLVRLGGEQKFIEKHGFDDVDVAVTLGFEDVHEQHDIDEEFDYRAACKKLHALHQTFEKRRRRARAPGHIAQNIARLSERVGLSETDTRVLEFTVCLHNEYVLEKAADWIGEVSATTIYHVLAQVLDLPEANIRKALKVDGALARSGLVRIDRDIGNTDLGQKLELLSSRFAGDIASHDDPVNALKNAFFMSAPPHLCLRDYPHLPELNALKLYLKQALSSAKRGVNIFLYGAPGTGKTQLARALAKATGCALYEIASEDDQHDAIKPEKRIQALRLAQHFFAGNKALLLFDEAEDVFGSGLRLFDLFFGKNSVTQAHKASTNRLLEETPVATLWLSNSAAGLDPAFARRFDMLVELPVPPRKQRRKIIDASCANWVGDAARARFAGEENLAPAVVTRAVSVVDAVKDGMSADEATAALGLLVNNTLKAQGHRPIPAHDPTALPPTYDPAFINTKEDVGQIAAGLKQTKSARLCLYGPPGTGKTAYARWLTEQLQMPLLAKRGSDLQSMWVGGTEKNIAAAFRQADTEDALLLIDEMDGFLQDRRRAERSWEVSHVNEMLTQMESFPGIFIASTNLFEHLDAAALRRFDLKLKFDFLRPRQIEDLFSRHCAELKIARPTRRTTATVARLGNATPGDFAAIVRRHRFSPLHTATQLADALAAECGMKENAPQPVGFV